MAKHENYDKYFEAARAIQAEGARVGIAICRTCGAAVLIDPASQEDYPRKHAEWHIAMQEDDNEQ